MITQLRTLLLWCLAPLFSLFFLSSVSAQSLTEGFESGLPATASTSAQNYTLGSGVWTLLNAQSASRAQIGSVALQLNTGSPNAPAYAAAPSLSAPSSITFWAAASAKSKIKVQKSVNGSAYSDITTLNVGTAYSSFTVAVNETSSNVRLRFANPGSQLLYVDNVSISGAAAASPALNTSVTSLPDFGSVSVGSTSAEKSYSVSASNLSPLSGAVSVAAPTGFEISLTSGSGFATSLSLAYSNGTLAATSVYVRFKPTTAQAYSGSITHSGGGAPSKTVVVSGTGSSTTPPPTSSSTAKYVSPSGNDLNAGTIDAPFKTIAKAVSVAVAGDTIFLRGGRHFYTTTISISKSGTSSNRYHLRAYASEKPILDFSGMAVSTSNRGLSLSGSYWHFKGIDFYKAGDNGMHMTGSNNIIEQCNFYENSDTGLQIGGGASNNQIINCDAYYNADPTEGNADGFAPKLDVGTGNSFKGCRAWQNSDDGWDGLLNSGFGQNPSTTYENCWVFLNGYLKDGRLATNGNGNGFKMGGNQERHDATLTNCLSAFNKAKGFDQNNNTGSMILYNCTGYKNGGPAGKGNFGMNNFDPAQGEVMVVKNCISYMGGTADVFRAVAQLSYNSWQNGLTVSDADFVTVDSIGLRAPRKADGSLPDINFMHLAPGSDLIDAGTNVGLSYNGAAPDLGCFETGSSALTTRRSSDEVIAVSSSNSLFQGHPNPVVAASTIRFQVPATTMVKITLLSINGQEVRQLFNGTAQGGSLYTLPFERAALKKGSYIAMMQTATERKHIKLVLQ